MDLFAEPPLNDLKARPRIAASFINPYCKVEDYTLLVPPYLMDYVHGDLFVNASPQKDIVKVAASVKAVLRLRSTSIHISPSERTVDFVAKLNATDDVKNSFVHALDRSRKQKRERDTIFRNLSGVIRVSKLPSHYGKRFPLWAISNKSFKDRVLREILDRGVHPLKSMKLMGKQMYTELMYCATHHENHHLHGKVKETADYVLKMEDSRRHFWKEIRRGEFDQKMSQVLDELDREQFDCKLSLRHHYIKFKTCADVSEAVARSLVVGFIKELQFVVEADMCESLQQVQERELINLAYSEKQGRRDWLKSAKKLVSSKEFNAELDDLVSQFADEDRVTDYHDWFSDDSD
ncbi:hypothetical protein HDU76_004419 [Blyttiomyces sp. JEL0837]|nr:hypothetical protein HDU76_004419 [Blyttiomyces sp. JEL0837]